MDWDFFLFSRGGDSETGEDESDETDAGVVASEGEGDAGDLGRSGGGGEDAAAGSTGAGAGSDSARWAVAVAPEKGVREWLVVHSRLLKLAYGARCDGRIRGRVTARKDMGVGHQ